MGILFGVAFLGAATALYPGGYQCGEHTISALFQSSTPSSVANPARPLVMMGVLTAMSGIALLFHLHITTGSPSISKENKPDCRNRRNYVHVRMVKAGYLRG